ncbi:hypothetical protein FB567DRAFT_542832 [Paraphoma chrysanthemicola]|uniref:Uncharacterized protein n=1 Tax=Paraphoma chrysanthemicola TaxID=798071 RepID=A0A8K0W393_9PLEO|nr:hypothetical protein FB567DRAFT_542832 [Paraphoma chrysanthemicola]
MSYLIEGRATPMKRPTTPINNSRTGAHGADLPPPPYSSEALSTHPKNAEGRLSLETLPVYESEETAEQRRSKQEALDKEKHKKKGTKRAHGVVGLMEVAVWGFVALLGGLVS